MANDKEIPVRSDTGGGGTSIVRTKDEARQALARISGKPKNEEVYWCMGCGFAQNPNDPSSCKYPAGMTLRFPPNEIEALGGDLSQYTGPCPICKAQLLVPKHQIAGQSIQAEAAEFKKREWHDQAEVQAEVFVDMIGKRVASGSIFDGALHGASEEEDVAHAKGDPLPDLPDAADVDRSDMKERE